MPAYIWRIMLKKNSERTMGELLEYINYVKTLTGSSIKYYLQVASKLK